MTNSGAARVLLEQLGGCLAAIGVELVNGRCIYAKEEVIISAGALRTPQVLMLSGLGPAAELQRHGITPILDLPGVGQHLFDHIMFPQYWRVRNPEKGVAAGSPAFSNPAFQKGVPYDWMLTESVASESLTKAFAADGEVIDDKHPYIYPPRSHYDALFCYAPAAAPMAEMEIPFDGTHIASCVMMLLPKDRLR